MTAAADDEPPELGLTGPIDSPPQFLNRLEVFKATQGMELTTERVVKRLQEIMNGSSDANSLRAIEQLRKLTEATEEDTRSGGGTTINGGVNFGADLERLTAALKTVDAETRREILDSLSGSGIVDAEFTERGA